MTSIPQKRQPMTDPSGFRTTLLQMADADDPAERRRLSSVLASEIEVALNRQANLAQVAVWDAEMTWQQKLDAMHASQSDTNILLNKAIESIGMVLTAQGDNAARLGKLQTQVDEVKDQVREVDTRNGGQWEEAMTVLRESVRHRAHLQEVTDAHEHAIQRLDTAVLAIEERDRLINLLFDAERRLGIVEAEIESLKAQQQALDPGGPL